MKRTLESKFLFVHRPPQMNFSTSLIWKTTVVRANWLFPGLYRRIASERSPMWLFLFISPLFHQSLDLLWEMLAVKVICACTLQLAVRQGVFFDSCEWGTFFWPTGVFLFFLLLFSTQQEDNVSKRCGARLFDEADRFSSITVKWLLKNCSAETGAVTF